MNSKGQEYHIERLMLLLIEKLGWGIVSDWHSKMFNELSEKVYESTGTLLSVATLKRFFGVVNHNGQPSISTLDALSQFIGFENWRDFKTDLPTIQKEPKFKSNFANRSVYMALGFVMAIVIVSIIASKPAPVVINSDEFSFSSKVLSNDYPNSVVFDFNIPKGPALDSIHIQQYWDPTKTIAIDQD